MYRLCFLNIFKRNSLNYVLLQIKSVHKNNIKIHNVGVNFNSHISLTRTITSKPHNITDKLLNKKETEEEFFVRLKNDPDVFGPVAEKEVVDQDDIKEEAFLENPVSGEQKLRTKQYADIIKQLIRNKKIKEAIDVLEIRMIKEDRVKPENYIFNLVLGACGRVGYTKKAFSLYNKMKQRGLKIMGGTYTALFNACANSPWPVDGLSRAKHLREIMIEKQFDPNETNYNAMIKAFGRCGSLETAFELVDEMKTKQYLIREDTMNFLLQACITDKEAGFRHSLLVWRKFIEKRITPNIYSYNLLLKTIRECGLGDEEVAKGVIDTIIQSSSNLPHDKYFLPSNHLDNHSSMSQVMNANKENNSCENNKNSGILIQNNFQENRPNLIARIPSFGNILSMSEVTKAEDRLLLIGGCSGFLQNMIENHCTPDIKTFTQLIECIPSTLAAEHDLIVAMKRFNVKPDVDFFNILIKKRSMRSDYDSAQKVLQMIDGAKLLPNLVTYGVLALGCKTKDEAQMLLAEMKLSNYRMNAEILGAMLHQACYHFSFPYVLKVMEMCITEEIRPNKKFMERLELFRKKCKNCMNEESVPTKSQSFQKGFTIFKLRYNVWKNEVDPIYDDEIHPWQQFRQESKTDTTHFKDKEAMSRFKPRHTSRFRQKKDSNIVPKLKKFPPKKDKKTYDDEKVEDYNHQTYAIKPQF